ILTGGPPYAGQSREVVQLRALTADLADSHARLVGCGADPELVVLAKRCLAAEPADRPADAAAVAQAGGGYLERGQEELRRAELAATETRGRRRLRRVVAAVLTTAVVVAVGLAAWAMREAGAARQAEGAAEQNAEKAKAQEVLAKANEAKAQEQAAAAKA